jgi:hypothetical protein
VRITQGFLPLLCFFPMSSMACFAQTQAVSNARDTPRITVRVYNYSQAPRTVIAGAQAEAAGVLSRAGLETIWLDCTNHGDSSSPDPACSVNSSGNVDFVMNIVNRLEDFDPWVHRAALGFSVIPADGEVGSTSYVSLPRVVRALAAPGHVPEAKLLGLAMAHELGHLLLGTADHSYRGIMRAFWPARYFENFDASEFLFTNNQVKHLRAAVLAREKRESELARLRSETKQH